MRVRVEAVWAGILVFVAGGLYLASCGPSGEAPRKGGGSSSAGDTAGTVAGASASATPPGEGSGAKVDALTGIAGWHAVYSAREGPSVRTWSPQAAFVLREGESVHPGVAASGLSAGYTGDVKIEEPGKYRFAAEMKGGVATLAVYAGGRAVGQGELSPDQSSVETGWIDLPAGAVSVSVAFTRNGEGPARLRTMWERAGIGGKGFRREAMLPDVVNVAGAGVADVKAGGSALRGRVLLGELNCVACHGSDASGNGADGAVWPRKAPLLGEVGRRASAEWLLSWVKHPQDMRPGAAMPALGLDEAQAEDVVHFLMSLGNVPEWQAPARETSVLDEGARLYHSVGCVACHGVLDDPGAVFKEPVPPRGSERSEPPAPFGKLARKWRPAGLAEFLVDPVRTHPSGRMPGMALSKAEADLIATYLVTQWDPDGFRPAAFAPDPERVLKGKEVFAASCAACHQIGHALPDVALTMKATPLSKLVSGRGCMDAADTKTPRYTLSVSDRDDLAAGLAEVQRMSGPPVSSPIDWAQRATGALNCRACHEVNGTGGVAEDIRLCFRTVDDAELGNEGRFPPRLTGVGTKLTTRWMKKVLMEGGRTRPYMMTRMPQFGGANVGELPGALAMAEGVAPETDVPVPVVTDAMVVAGRTLVGEKGMNCISCHVYGKRIAGTLGPDINGFAEQLRYEWWKPYLQNPGRFKPGTRMSAFYHYPDGKSQQKDVLGGDFDRQAEALWAYFVSSGGVPAPEGLPAEGGLPLVVGARPVVFRTFLKDAGSRGIAVGYPIGVHFGFDATGVRLVSAWKGEFIDATSTWKGRGGMTATGQGQTIWKAPPGPALVIGERPSEWPRKAGAEGGYRFEGYRLNKAGVPTFLYRVGGNEVEEVFEPAEHGQVRRTFVVKGLSAGQVVWLNTGPGVVSSTALANISEDRVQAIGDQKVSGYTAKEAGEVSFAVMIKPEVK
ncbi:MAG: c-type cytochrome [Phycisphaeraceae bacterium]|nr:c-type cytochrome [Phycisphaeraceae bacterium]